MAAGLGFKTFTTGEVLTSADVNGYLMQGILVFATEAARNSAITSPQEGQFAFTKDTNSLWYYTGSAWVASGATGDIEGVTAGVGISGGGTSGTVTITNSMATEITAKADLIVGTGNAAFDNLPVGTNGHVLTADSTVSPTGLKWAAPAAGAATNWTLLNAGGTALTGATTITVSFTAPKQIMVLMIGASAGARSFFTLRPNNISTADYSAAGSSILILTAANYAEAYPIGGYSSLSEINFGIMADNAASVVSAACSINLTDQTGWKDYAVTAGANAGGGSQNVQYFTQGILEAAAAITSITVLSSVGNFDAGTLYILGAN